MKAYYNEHDRQAAAWLRELIKQGVITDGTVDERSIEDVVPAELAEFDRCHFFAGIGVWDYALNQAGWPSDRRVWTGSCPCQPFSAAGKGEGFTDERHLWPAWFHLIEQCRPRAIFGEQVSSKDAMPWIDVVQADLEGALYTVGTADLCSPSVGAPHIRQRLYFVAESECRRAGREIGNGSGSKGKTQDCRRPRIGTDEARNGRPISTMAVSDGGNTGTERLQRSGQHGQQPQDGRSGSVADTLPTGWAKRRSESGNGSIAKSGGFDGLGDSGGPGLQGGEQRASRNGNGNRPNAHGPIGQPGRSSNGVILGDAATEGLSERPSETVRGGQARDFDQRSSDAGPTNGFWRDAEWIYCRDEKYRPVEPGTFPLVTGAPARVGRLRGYGNSIVAPLAIAWIESYLDLIS